MGKDLGTYHLRVELKDGRGWIQIWETGARYTHGSGSCTKLDATRIEPTWDDEDDLFSTMLYMYTEGNYSCDCNRSLFWLRSQQLSEDEKLECGETMQLLKLTVIKPGGGEEVLLEQENK